MQEYSEITRPMARIHIDLTGELTITDGNRSRYILVVKEFHIWYVWLVALNGSSGGPAGNRVVLSVGHTGDGGVR